ncbi:ABC-2 type transport system ATP-binding protein [Arthrobacter silviterrae]|uniref:ATP-binding cassette domain-containing protein n=1 Tax=Arthrobacter silviterrae TaxID=2026658 RepID=A0ABX0DAU6_9MICC|nr:ATP-binding cassette domain-containing protein [Arthrobacter silviterrae]MDQ0276090.1 ABC-2 type transport system ATP-binding protein [Arthrobacter silviterrae]NGN82555.1 ATP-binding cassette domain-containing protein [Arthrobacter silviterrae]
MAHNPTPAAIEAGGLTKSYPGGRGKPPTRALAGLSFAVEPGTIFGLLGPNGAGKSTTVRILATLATADSGKATVAGHDVGRHPGRVRHAIGFVAQKQVSDPMDTGRENLVLAGRLQGLSGPAARARATELLERFSLTDAAGRLVKTYSGGMARKLDVAIGLMHRPRVLFLDEPTTGLDPEARADMWAELEGMARAEEMTVLLTTHYLEEADRLARRLAIVDKGRIVVEGTPGELKDALHGDAVVVELADPARDAGRAREVVAGAGLLREILADGRFLRGRADAGGTALPAVLARLEAAGIAVVSATVARPSLDDVYLRHTGHVFAQLEVAA